MKGREVNYVSIYRGEGRVKAKQPGLAKYQRLAKPFPPLGQGQEKEPSPGPVSPAAIEKATNRKTMS